MTLKRVDCRVRSQGRSLGLDFAKGIGIILVAWGHADIKLDPIFYQQKLKFIHYMIFSFHMPLFFIISAALTTKLMGSIHFNEKRYLQKITSSLLFPFLSLSIVFAIVNIIIPQSFYATPSIKEMVISILFMQSSIDFMPSPALWFLFSLFSFAFVTYILVLKLKMNKYLILIISILLALAHPFLSDVDIMGLRRFLYNYEFFVIGYILARHIINRDQKISYVIIFLLFFFWLIPFVVEGIYGVFTHLITGTAGSLFIIFLSNRMNHSSNHFLWKYIYRCGEYSILIYVFHMPVYVLIKKIVYFYGLSSSYLGLFIMVVSGVVIPLIIGNIISHNIFLYKLLFWRSPNRTIHV